LGTNVEFKEPLWLTKGEVEWLRNVLDQHNEGVKAAKVAVVEDRSLPSMHALLDTHADLANEEDLVKRIQRRLSPMHKEGK
jgi:hypothetical protein